jgi:hypothetical protein
MRSLLAVPVLLTSVIVTLAFDRSSVEAPPDEFDDIVLVGEEPDLPSFYQKDFFPGQNAFADEAEENPDFRPEPFDRSSVESGSASDVYQAENAVGNSNEDQRANNKKRNVICYFSNWASLREGDGKFVPENIDASLCSHVFYAFASLNPDSLEIVPASPRNDIDNGKLSKK